MAGSRHRRGSTARADASRVSARILCLIALLAAPALAGNNPHAFACLAVDGSYATGCLGLGKSLLHTGSLKEADFLVLYLPDQVPEEKLQELASISPNVVLRTFVPLNLTANKHYVHGHDKICCWQQTDYDKICYLDADILAMQNLNHLFGYDELGVTQDMYFYLHKTFNSGLLVLKPSNETFEELVAAASPRRHTMWGDQEFFNERYKRTANYLPANTLVLNWVMTMKALPLQAYWQSAQAIHFAGIKPWVNTSDPAGGHYLPHGDNDLVRWPVLGALRNLWWRIYYSPINMTAEHVVELYAVPKLSRPWCHIIRE